MNRLTIPAPQPRAAGVTVSLCALLWLLMAASARADQPKRAVPDYSARPNTASAWLWIPRVALSPLYLVGEYGIRRPLGFLVSSAERANLPQFLYGARWRRGHARQAVRAQ